MQMTVFKIQSIHIQFGEHSQGNEIYNSLMLYKHVGEIKIQTNSYTKHAHWQAVQFLSVNEAEHAILVQLTATRRAYLMLDLHMD